MVAAEVGSPSVAEAAALTAARAMGRRKLGELWVEKQIFKQDAQAVTVYDRRRPARTSLKRDSSGWWAQGPEGILSQQSPAARTAILEADVLMSYGLYLDLIKPFRRPGQICETFPLTQEQQRCQQAIMAMAMGIDGGGIVLR